ncbi:hypothetical protein Tco_0705139 [Tanacetum coccineum]|uniref:Uncharacterized protein n=1 Tax=Tanacetum coccineum TaxID=301880 RepID=A0ABQ4Y3Q7_9ASTR
MMTLKFVDSYNMVAYLERPINSDDFTEIVDFLNAKPIRYALIIHALVDGKKIVITKSFVRRDLQFADADGTCLSPKKTAWNEFSSNIASAIICLATNQKFNFSKMVFDEGDSLERAATTASSLEAEQVSGNITKTQSKATLNVPTPQGTSSGSGPRRQDTIGDTIARTSMQLKELMEMCIDSLQRVQDLETTKTAQAKEIISLKKRVKNLKQRGRSRTQLKKVVQQGLEQSRRLNPSSIDASWVIRRNASIQGEYCCIEANVIFHLFMRMQGFRSVRSDDGEDIVLIQAIGVVMQEPSEIPRISAAQPQIQEKAQGLRDKGKVKMVEEEEPKEPTKIKDQIKHDEELAKRLEAQLQAEMEEEDRHIARQKRRNNFVSWKLHKA